MLDEYTQIHSENLEPTQSAKIGFLHEQLSLVFSKPRGRRYSPGLLAMALLWENISPALYKQLLSANVLTLPSITWLKHLSRDVKVGDGLPQSTISYLKERIKPLCSREKNVTMMIDEIYSAQRVEFVGGNFIGQGDDGKC